jgi:predicted homoserine dehydrogenase-like protein
MSYRDRLQHRLEDTGRPLRVGLVGAGQMGRGFAAQLLRMPGISLSAVLDVQRERAEDALGQAGIKPADVASLEDAVKAIEEGGSVALGSVDEIGGLPLDIVVEATGVPDVGARTAIESLAAGMGFATLNVESDVTIGRYLALLAEGSEGIYSVCRGDEPVETKILVDFARDLNFEVICAGKGKNNPLDPTATPESLTAQATAKGMNPKMLTSFVDGSKAMIEMAALANTTGLGVSKRGMHGPPSTVPTLHQTFALQADGGVLEKAGVVDYCTGPVAPGVFVVVHTDDPYVHHEMTYLQMGDGPYFAFYRPYHLASIEAPLTVYEMALDKRASLTSEHWTAEVGAEAKRALRAGEKIDGIGGSTVRGMIDDSAVFAEENGVPLGVLAGATVVRDVPEGQLLTYLDVELLEDSTIVRMRRIQEGMDDQAPPDLAALRSSLAAPAGR